MDPNKNNQPPIPGSHRMLRGDYRKVADEIKRSFLEHVRELLQQMTPSNLPPQRVLPHINMQPQYVLQFINEVLSPIFSSDLVRDKNGSPMKVALYDTYTQSIIFPDNFLSSAKVQITVLDAELRKTGEFNQSVLSERENKGPLLTGSRIIQLENGVGTFENLVINDNSSWTKSGFQLGVMVVSDGQEGYFNRERVQEAVSKPFRVKDRRMKANQKPDLLELTHSVQFIKKIGKDRTSFLQTNGINTVEDFLCWYYNRKSELRKILGIKSESNKEWESMIDHVLLCEGEYHAKWNASNNSSQPWQTSVVPKEGNCGSSEPNPSQNVRIEGSMPAIFGETQLMAPVIPNDGGIAQSYTFGLSVDDYLEYELLGNSTPNYGSGGSDSGGGGGDSGGSGGGSGDSGSGGIGP